MRLRHRTLPFLWVVLLGALPHARADGPAPSNEPTLRSLLVDVHKYGAQAKIEQVTLDGLLETKTERHPKVIAARARLTAALQAKADAERVYQEARQRAGLNEAAKLPEAPGESAELVTARIDGEAAAARMRALMEQHAAVQDELRTLRGSKTDAHPKVRAALGRKARLDVEIAQVQGQIARAREHVRWLEAQEAAKRPDSLPALHREVRALRAEVKHLRAAVAELKTLLKESLAK